MVDDGCETEKEMRTPGVLNSFAAPGHPAGDYGSSLEHHDPSPMI